MNTGNKSAVSSQQSVVSRKKTAIFYITATARFLAQKLQGLYPDAKIEKFNSGAVRKLWDKSKNIIFIMASGIVVRTIAPLIKNKKTDPAVVVLDEKGEYAISLLSGHLGGANKIAKEIANFLGGKAVITTASDVNNLPSIDLWAKENDLAIENWDMLSEITTRFLNSKRLNVYSDIDIKLPKEFQKTDEPESAGVIVSNKNIPFADSPIHRFTGLYLRPKNLVIGIGCNSKTPEEEIETAVKKTLKENNLSFLSIHSIATIDKKGKEPGLSAFAKKYNLGIKTFSADELNSAVSHPLLGGQEPSAISISKAAFKATGAYAVAEPAALLGAGADKLLVRKQKKGNVTIAIAEQKSKVKGQKLPPHPPLGKGGLKGGGKLYIVGTGPGSLEHITPYAQKAIRKADVIVGYGTYLDLIEELIKDKEVVSTGMTQEIDRCKKAVELALSGKTVAVISGGDPGIYAMAGLVLEMLRAEVPLLHGESVNRLIGESQKQSFHSPIHPFTHSPIQVEVIPGISALNACAARLGAPLMHDFASISLSDRLTPWELIEKRLEAAAMSDFVIVLYNPKSKGRPEHINRAGEIILKHRAPETPVGIVKGAMREDEKVIISDLKNMLEHDIDMQTTVIIGNSQTIAWDKWMITPRGYSFGKSVNG